MTTVYNIERVAEMANSISRELESERGRRTARILGRDDVLRLVTRAAARAARADHVRLNYVLGGSVCNSYGYRAYSEAVVILICGSLMTYGVASAIPANKITSSGAVAACLGDEYRALLDNRYGDVATEAARSRLQADYFWTR